MMLAGHGLAQDNKARIAQLIEQLKSQDGKVIISASSALVQIGKEAVPALIATLKDQDELGRGYTAAVLGMIGKEAVPALIAALKDQNESVRNSAADALGQIGPEAKEAVPALIAALKDQGERVRSSAAYALGWIGPEAKEALPALIAALKDQERHVRSSAARALGSIATALFDAKTTEMLPSLRSAYEAMKDESDPGVQKHAAEVKRTVDYFESLLWWIRLKELPIKLAGEHPYIASAVIAYLLLQLTWLLFFWRWPLRLLQVVVSLDQTGAKLKLPWTDIPIPIKHALVFPLLHYRPRLLDAWVRHHLATAKDNFASHPTVAQRKVYVAMPATINDEMCDSPSAAQLQPIFAKKKKLTALLVGEGGAGKTSLACQMANWAMSDEPDERLCQTHRMLPVLIEGNLEARTDGKDALLEAIRGRLQDLIGEPKAIFEELLRELLGKRRVLVIVDSLSELNDTTRKSVRPAQADFPVAALVVTSRLEEDLGGAAKTTIKPLRLKSDRLSTFMDRYLSQRGKRELFEDEEYFEACRRLSQIVGEREITVLIARMYAEQIIAAKEQATERDLPRNLPDLMLGSVKNVNDQVQDGKQETRQVISVAKLIAWECLKQTCRPTAAKRDDVLRALKDETNAEALLQYLETRLQLIQTTGAGADQIRFTLDPLAEYLAGFYLIERCGENEKLWQEFLDKAQTDAPEAIKGFLLAVRDCCVEKGSEHCVPEKINDELARLACLDAETIRAARLKKRIKLLIANLESPDALDRIRAAENLAKIGLEAKVAVPTLIEALKEPNADVQLAVINALRMIGFETEAVVPSLIALLKSPNSLFKQIVARMLGDIGSGAEAAVPALIDVLKNEDELDFVCAEAACALGMIGQGKKDVIDASIEALSNWRVVVRRTAAGVLGQFGSEAKNAVPTLIELLKDKDGEVRFNAAKSLKMISPETEVATLVEAQQDQ